MTDKEYQKYFKKQEKLNQQFKEILNSLEKKSKKNFLDKYLDIKNKIYYYKNMELKNDRI